MSRLKTPSNRDSAGAKKDEDAAIVDAARILSSLKFARTKGDNSDSDDSHFGDDYVFWNDKRYYYHPPEIGDKVWALYNDGNWYVGTLKKIITRKNKEPKYEIHYKKEKWHLFLSIKNFPQKWHFVE